MQDLHKQAKLMALEAMKKFIEKHFIDNNMPTQHMGMSQEHGAEEEDGKPESEMEIEIESMPKRQMNGEMPSIDEEIYDENPMDDSHMSMAHSEPDSRMKNIKKVRSTFKKPY